MGFVGMRPEQSFSTTSDGVIVLDKRHPFYGKMQPEPRLPIIATKCYRKDFMAFDCALRRQGMGDIIVELI